MAMQILKSLRIGSSYPVEGNVSLLCFSLEGKDQHLDSISSMLTMFPLSGLNWE
jgi:hypothetical protein